jgi:hypothetical protein
MQSPDQDHKPGNLRLAAQQGNDAPFFDLAFGALKSHAKKVHDAVENASAGEERRKRHGRANVEPRLMAFLAYLAAIGLLAVKGMVESVADPLLYSDDQLIQQLECDLVEWDVGTKARGT